MTQEKLDQLITQRKAERMALNGNAPIHGAPPKQKPKRPCSELPIVQRQAIVADHKRKALALKQFESTGLYERFIPDEPFIFATTSQSLP